MGCFLSKKKNAQEKIFKKIMVSLVVYFVSCVIIIYSNLMINGIWGYEDYAPLCYEYSDGKNKIVIEECSFLRKIRWSSGI